MTPLSIEEFSTYDDLMNHVKTNQDNLMEYFITSIYKLNGRRLNDDTLRKAALTENAPFIKFKEGSIIRLGQLVEFSLFR